MPHPFPKTSAGVFSVIIGDTVAAAGGADTDRVAYGLRHHSDALWRATACGTLDIDAFRVER